LLKKPVLAPIIIACVERGEVNIAAERLQQIAEVLGIKLLNI